MTRRHRELVLWLLVASLAVYVAVLPGHARGGIGPTAAQKTGQVFAGRLAHRWNGTAGVHGFPADKVQCVPYGLLGGSPTFSCEWRFLETSTGRYWCRWAVLTTSFYEVDSAWVKCVGGFTPPPRTPAA